MTGASRPRPTIRDVLRILGRTVQAWGEDNGSLFAAALSFYALFSLAPLLVIATAVAGLFVGSEASLAAIEGQLHVYLNNADLVDVVMDIVARTAQLGSGLFASTVGIGLILYGASRAFVQLQLVLNAIWGVRRHKRPARGALLNVARSRGLSLAMVLGAGLLLLVSLASGPLIAGGLRLLGTALPLPRILFVLVDHLTSFAVLFVAASVVYRVLPDMKLRFRDVMPGALLVTVLLLVGRWGIASYLSRASVSSTYGAAGSFAALLLFFYYSALIFLVAAEFNAIWARERGYPVEPSPVAYWIVPPSGREPASAASTTPDASSSGASEGALDPADADAPADPDASGT